MRNSVYHKISESGRQIMFLIDGHELYVTSVSVEELCAELTFDIILKATYTKMARFDVVVIRLTVRWRCTAVSRKTAGIKGRLRKDSAIELTAHGFCSNLCLFISN